MARMKEEPDREERIRSEIVVDAYGAEERAMGWYYYLEQELHFPFVATCVAERAISPLRVDERVEVTDMAPEDECTTEMFVTVNWQGRAFGVPLAQLRPLCGDPETVQAIEDWHYWTGQGYEFG